MAKLLKENGRKPVMETASPVGRPSWVDGQPMYRVDLHSLHSMNDKSHQVLLTRAEMLSVVSEWLKTEAQIAKDAEKPRG